MLAEGQLGIGNEDHKYEPVKASSFQDILRPWLTSVTQISVGYQTTCALTRENEIYCWGLCDKCQCGTSTTESQLNSPTKVEAVPAQYTITSISTGYSHTCATTADDAVICWGQNKCVLTRRSNP